VDHIPLLCLQEFWRKNISRVEEEFMPTPPGCTCSAGTRGKIGLAKFIVSVKWPGAVPAGTFENSRRMETGLGKRKIHFHISARQKNGATQKVMIFIA
jgi:hypothetical protein